MRSCFVHFTSLNPWRTDPRLKCVYSVLWSDEDVDHRLNAETAMQSAIEAMYAATRLR